MVMFISLLEERNRCGGSAVAANGRMMRGGRGGSHITRPLLGDRVPSTLGSQRVICRSVPGMFVLFPVLRGYREIDRDLAGLFEFEGHRHGLAFLVWLLRLDEHEVISA